MDIDKNTLFSHHIFLFPFKWDIKCNENGEDLNSSPFIERTDLKAISDIFDDKSNFDERVKWEKYEFNLKQPRDYNEFTYFYEYVTPTLFDNSLISIDNKVILQYSLDLLKNKSKFIINVAERNLGKEKRIEELNYELNIEDVVINFYNTGIGILSFHLSNYFYSDPEEILDINDFGRRIYPQFLDDLNYKNPLGGTKKSFLANKIHIEIVSSEVENTLQLYDTFDEYDSKFENFNPQFIHKLPNYIRTILGNKFKDTELDLRTSEVKITPVIDDRMFTLCWYGNNKYSSLLKEKERPSEGNDIKYNYEKNELWNRFIFVDNRNPGIANRKLLEELNFNHTYARWVDNGTLFGISRYSFIVLTDNGFFSKNILLPHLQTMYFQIVMLALLQRASIIRFSYEATKVKFLDRSPKGKEVKRKLQYVTQLYERYLHFVNKMFFREPTAQEQGIELYDMLLEKMRIEREVKDLDRELDEINKYVSLIANSKENDEIRILTKLAASFLPATLIAGILGMNTLPNTYDIPDYLFNGGVHLPVISSIVLMVICTGILFLVLKILRSKNE